MEAQGEHISELVSAGFQVMVDIPNSIRMEVFINIGLIFFLS
jgi:hypothetical protein